MRIIIAGSRTFNNYYGLREGCKNLIEFFLKGQQITKEDIEIISGGAQGADRLGESFAKEFKLKLKKFPADWDTFGKSAGYRRNEEMAKYASGDTNNALFVFWDGKSKGTKHMIDLAEKYGIMTFRFLS